MSESNTVGAKLRAIECRISQKKLGLYISSNRATAEQLTGYSVFIPNNFYGKHNIETMLI